MIKIGWIPPDHQNSCFKSLMQFLASALILVLTFLILLRPLAHGTPELCHPALTGNTTGTHHPAQAPFTAIAALFRSVTPFTTTPMPGTTWTNIKMNDTVTAIGANTAATRQSLQITSQGIFIDAGDVKVSGCTMQMLRASGATDPAIVPMGAIARGNVQFATIVSRNLFQEVTQTFGKTACRNAAVCRRIAKALATGSPAALGLFASCLALGGLTLCQTAFCRTTSCQFTY